MSFLHSGMKKKPLFETVTESLIYQTLINKKKPKIHIQNAKNTQPAAIPTLGRQAEVLCSPPPQAYTHTLPSSLQH